MIKFAQPDLYHRRQGPLCGARKTYTKPSTFVKYVIKFVGTTNPITNFKFVEEYVENNKQSKYLIFNFLAHPIPNSDYVSHARFNCVVIAKPFKYLNYEEDYVSTAYLGNVTGFRNPYGSRVGVLAGTGTGRDSPTRVL
jgi:hypothetical protein